MPAGFDSEGKALVADFRANEKFHLSPAFGGADQLCNAVNQLQSLLYAVD
jgi:hypothetical protein